MTRFGILCLGRRDAQGEGQNGAARPGRAAWVLAVGAAVALSVGLAGLQVASASEPMTGSGQTTSPSSEPLSANLSPSVSPAPIAVGFPLHPFGSPSPSPSPLPANLVLSPNAAWHSFSYHEADDGANWYCPPFGLTPPSDWANGVAFPETAVGYTHYNDPGTQPLPCWQWYDLYDRGAVQFDWNQVNSYVQAHGFKSATLTYHANQGDMSCVAQVQEDSTDLSSFDFNSGPIPAGRSLTPSPVVNGTGARVDVGAVVGLGVAFGGVDPHMHFVFIGKDESLSEQDNNSCTATLGNLKLTITPEH